ncbi:MAG: exosortase system-associated protein, TIGR04073 family [Verrucomicrobiota bacterium]
MRNTFSLLAAVALTGLLATGCSNMQQKLGRGTANTTEIIRMGEMRRTMEQTSLTQGAQVGRTTGFVTGLSRSLARTGIGVYEVVTFPFPPYGPVFTDHFAVNPVYPDSYKPGMSDSSTYATDTYLGFSGGDVAPGVPGSRFMVFDTH